MRVCRLQVLPDWQHHAGDDVASEQPAKKVARLQTHEARIHRFFACMEEDARRVRDEAEPKLARMANRYFASANDNALRCGAGLSLEHFRSDKKDWALPNGRIRYVVANPRAGA
jgi:hypothetical protein